MTVGRRQLLVATPAILAATVAGDPGTGRAPARRGGLPPARPDQRYAPPFPASVPPGRGNIVRARQVIISGPGEGLFVYVGTPALGNPPVASLTTTTKDPSGNTVPAAFALSGLPELIYAGSPALGNLIASNVPDANIPGGGTEIFGNHYLGGFTVYQTGASGTKVASQFSDGAINYYSGNLAAGWVSASAGILFERSTPNGLNIFGTLSIGPSAVPIEQTGQPVCYSTLGDLDYVSGNDGNSYDTGRLTVRTPNPSGAGQIINNTLATILQKPIGIGTYHIRGCVVYVGNQAGGVPTVSLAFPAVSNNTLQRVTYTVMGNGATQPVPLFSRSNTGISAAGPTLVLNQFVAVDLDVMLTTTAAGNFTVSGQSSILGDTFTIQALSYIEIEPVVAS